MASSQLSFGLLATTLASFAAFSHAQTSSPAISTVKPAATTVSKSCEAGAPLFDVEAVQLTGEVVARLEQDNAVAEYAHLFEFDNSTEVSNGDGGIQRRFGGCKTLPGDFAWPHKIAWDIFDLLLGGALQPITPIASPCYKDSVYDNYDADQCAKIVEDWTVPELHTDDAGSIMFPLFEGRTCLPSLDPVGNCTQGGYSSYAVDVSNAAQIQLAVNFARATNIRLVVRNTGHDYNGRSTGAGALAVWTHHLKDIQYISMYKSAHYLGPAFKVGAGVQVFEVYEAAEKYGVTALGGICPSVGFAGGYLAGGGHSPLMQIYGMAADQILALEVVTADGRFVTATPNHNRDLFWALSGGGGGTFGIVTSVIVKVHPKIHATTSRITFGSSENVTADTFFEGVKAYWDLFIPFLDAETYSYFWISGVGGNFGFDMHPFYAPNYSIDEFNALVKPWFDRLNELGIPFEADTKHHDSFLASYDATFGPQNYNIGGWSVLPGVRLLPRSNWETEKKRNETFAVVRNIVETYGMVGGYHQSPKNPPGVSNGVNSHLRDEAAFLIVASAAAENATDEQLREAGRTLTNDILGPLRDVSPDGGAYANEADVNEPNWQDSFWGTNYERLLRLKKRFDPWGLFYVHHGVGSEAWEVRDGAGVPTQNGRLCRV